METCTQVWEQLQKVELAQQHRRQQDLDDKLREAKVRARAEGFRIVLQSASVEGPQLSFLVSLVSQVWKLNNGFQAFCAGAPPCISRAFVFVDIWFMCVCVCVYAYMYIDICKHACMCVSVCLCIGCVHGQGREAEMRSILQVLIADLREHLLLRYFDENKLFVRVVSKREQPLNRSMSRKGKRDVASNCVSLCSWVGVLHAVSPAN